MIPTSNKDEFLAAFKKVGIDVSGAHVIDAKALSVLTPAAAAAFLNDHPDLRTLFREAVEEAEAEAANPAAGLANLFGDM